tara:strand:+ start:256 stop:411 length:156 start_codon:yes stop_codon:yes gene_type:complete
VTGVYDYVANLTSIERAQPLPVFFTLIFEQSAQQMQLSLLILGLDKPQTAE